MVENLKEYLEGSLIIFKGGNISNIRANAFKGITTLNIVELDGGSTVLDNVNAFDGCTGLAHIYVPEEYVDTYKAAPNWSNFADIINKKPKFNRVGGRIFYIDSSTSGAEYRFYDVNENLIDDQSSIAALENAYYYTKVGVNTNNKDRFYVADIANSNAVRKYNDVNYVKWSLISEDLTEYAEDMEVVVTAADSTLGRGKLNTAWISTYRDDANYYPNRYGVSGSITCWDFCYNCNRTSLNDCEDWFVPNVAEVDLMRQSGIWGAKGTTEGITKWHDYIKYGTLKESSMFVSTASNISDSTTFIWTTNPSRTDDRSYYSERNVRGSTYVTTVARSF